MDQSVPYPITLSKLVGWAGPEVLDQRNAALLAKLAASKLLRCRKLRVDTTVVDHPTDADLPEHAVRTPAGWSAAPAGAVPRPARGSGTAHARPGAALRRSPAP